MEDLDYTPFSYVYESFLSKITDDMYVELTPQDTYNILQDILKTAIHKFEFPRRPLDYEKMILQDEGWEQEEQTQTQEELQQDPQEQTQTETEPEQEQEHTVEENCFIYKLTQEEINILSTYMIVEWIGIQLASIENTRMKYGDSNFKFTSQANHMQKLLQLKKDYQREGFHLQRLYKRRKKDCNGIYRSTFGKIMQNQPKGGTGQWHRQF